VELAYATGGQLQGLHQIGVHRSLLYGIIGYFKARGLDPVEEPCIAKDGGISLPTYVIQYLGHDFAHRHPFSEEFQASRSLLLSKGIQV
jgi:hypothetical protein